MRAVAGVYISFPFCAQKCTYCNFASGVFPRGLEAPYLAALAREIAGHRWEWRPETAYIGGGTPSLIECAALVTLLSGLPGRPWAEATMEAAPGTVTLEKARSWRASGINRVSLGVQSFVESEIRRTGRKHTAQVVEREVALLRGSGISNLNIDLIAGLAGQTERSWRASLDWIERLAPPHVSVYMLEVDSGSRLGGEMLLGGVRYGASDVPGEGQIADMYEYAVERLAGLGTPRYEISNFARPGIESRHNLKYWRLEPYVGFGADAHSYNGAVRRGNAETVADYLKAERGEETKANRAEERLFVGLRLSEGVEMEPGDRAALEPFEREGMVEVSGNRARLTNRGVLLSNEIFQEFLLD